MIFKNTWLWIILAVALLGASVWHYRHGGHVQTGPRKILSQLNAASITNVQVHGPQLQIRAERTNSNTWVLAEPVAYPAEGRKVDVLLAALERMTPAVYI